MAQQDWLCIPTPPSDDGLWCAHGEGVPVWLHPHGRVHRASHLHHGETHQAVSEAVEGKGCLRERCVWMYIAEGG